jgi:WD40 repeat protein
VNDQQLATALRSIHTDPAKHPDADSVVRDVTSIPFHHTPQQRGFLLISQPFERQGGVPGAAPVDPGTFSPAGSLAQPRGEHSATLLPDGRVLIVGGFDTGDPASAEVWDPETATFSPAGSLAERRQGPNATLLLDGRVLIVSSPTRDHASAEVWDPETATFSPAGSLAGDRSAHSATLLPDGRVLVVGGCPDGGHLVSGDVCDDDLASVEVEVWDPATGTFSPAGSLAGARSGHSDTLLPDGRVLVVGGCQGHNCDDDPDAEVWDPETSTFSPAGSPAMGGVGDAVLLPDGRVFVVGEGIKGGNVTAEIWDPATGTFSPAGSAAMGWVDLAGLLPDGRVLVYGGGLDVVATAGEEYGNAAAAVWDPATGTFSPFIPAGSLPGPRTYGTKTLLPDGRLLILGDCLGGQCARRAPTSTEIWDPATGYAGPTGSLAEEHRFGHSATLLADGRVLVVGGASADVWDPADR